MPSVILYLKVREQALCSHTLMKICFVVTTSTPSGPIALAVACVAHDGKVNPKLVPKPRMRHKLSCHPRKSVNHILTVQLPAGNGMQESAACGILPIWSWRTKSLRNSLDSSSWNIEIGEEIADDRNTRTCFSTCGHVAGIHGDVSNVHTEAF